MKSSGTSFEDDNNGGNNGVSGHSLGGSAGGPLTPAEVRRRRLAALDKNASTIESGSAVVKSVHFAEQKQLQIIDPVPECDDDEDAELQAALALSMQKEIPSPMKESGTAPPGSVNNMATEATSTESMMLDDAIQNSPTTKSAGCFLEAPSAFDVRAFHDIMWDSTLTTDSDKQRWVGQRIDVRNRSEDSETMEIDSDSSSNVVVTNSSTMLKQVSASHLPWGLLQQHGGPCGVLAAVQAEMLRFILFENEADKEQQTETIATNQEAELDPSLLSPERVMAALARAIGVILARAALMPPVYAAGASDQDNITSANATTARVVLLSENKSQTSLLWEDLEPWNQHEKAAFENMPPNLFVYTIGISEALPPGTAIAEGKLSSAAGPTKRQKITSGDGNNLKPEEDCQGLEFEITRLADAVSEFLLKPLPNRSKGATAPLDSFRSQGGVLLLVMSLIASREGGGSTISISKEFDDPIGTRLTSQFGHCGQELMNLLLTGQAVSNVFDNSLTLGGGTPSEDGDALVCKGIQRPPGVGYLSQLESMRYCEVGSFYKSPKFPIWVVGSTSHFTVLFGDRSSLKESKSDQLLEKCRRAFKAVEGGEENGFIATQYLGDVLKALNLTTASTGLNEDSAVQTLAATLEMGGSGIILWDDFWKKISRLLTGASLQAVLLGGQDEQQGEQLVGLAIENTFTDTPLIPVISNGVVIGTGDDPLLVSEGQGEDLKLPAEQVQAQASAVETDEEMAKRLEAEWNNEDNISTLAVAAEHVASPMEADTAVDTKKGVWVSDKELARLLQAEWNGQPQPSAGTTSSSITSAETLKAENTSSSITSADVAAVATDASSTPAVDMTPSSSSHPQRTPDPLPLTIVMEDQVCDNSQPADVKPGTSTATARTTSSSLSSHKDSSVNLEFEKHGDSFYLCHYNGLRGGTLTPFRITRLSPEEAVGASIALSRNTASHNSGGLPSGGAAGGSGGDLEDVVRTKWPSCMVNWLGKSPPYID